MSSLHDIQSHFLMICEESCVHIEPVVVFAASGLRHLCPLVRVFICGQGFSHFKKQMMKVSMQNQDMSQMHDLQHHFLMFCKENHYQIYPDVACAASG